MESIFKFWQNVETRAKQVIPPQVFPAVVKEVDEDLRTCTVRINDNVDFEDVRLFALPDDSLKGFCLIPAKDSTVLVARIAGCNDLFVTSFSVVDKVIGTIGDKMEVAMDAESLSYKCDKTEAVVKSNDIQVKTENVTFTVSDKKVTVDADEVVFNKGNNAGMVKVQGLTKQLNAIEQDINTLKGVFKGWEPVLQDGGKVLQAAAAPWAAQTLTLSKDENYEDENVKH